MGKIRSKVALWQPSETPDVTYRLYWAIWRPVAHNLDYADVGTVTEVTLPDDIRSFPLVAGKIVLGVSAIAASGNESDITIARVFVDFTVPAAPKVLTVED